MLACEQAGRITHELHEIRADWDDKVTIDPTYGRPAEVDLLIGDSSKTRSVLGWEPTVTFDQLIRSMVQHDIAEQTALSTQPQ